MFDWFILYELLNIVSIYRNIKFVSDSCSHFINLIEKFELKWTDLIESVYFIYNVCLTIGWYSNFALLIFSFCLYFIFSFLIMDKNYKMSTMKWFDFQFCGSANQPLLRSIIPINGICIIFLLDRIQADSNFF